MQALRCLRKEIAAVIRDVRAGIRSFTLTGVPCCGNRQTA